MRSVYLDNLLIRFEVGTAGTSGIRHPHPLSLAGLRLGSFHIRQDNDAIKAVIINILGRSVKIRTPAENSLSLLALAFLPDVDFAFVNSGIEGHHRKLSQLGKAIQLSKESSGLAMRNFASPL